MDSTRSRFRRRILSTLLALVTGVVLGTGVSTAVATLHSGTVTSVQYFAGEGAPWSQGVIGAWSNLPSAAVNVTVPAGATRLINTRFTGETLCNGTGGWCSARTVVVYTSGVVVELNPVTSTDFKLDMPGGAAEEAVAFERTSGSIGPGSYTVRVQVYRHAGTTQFTLDDYHFAVGLVSP